MFCASSIDEWQAWLESERQLQPETVKAYRRELAQLAARFRDRSLDELGTEDLRTFSQERGGAAATVARRLAALKSFYGYLVRTDRRATDPTARILRPKVRRGLPRPVAEPDRAIARLDPTARQIAVLLRETGLRISEACAIRVPLPAPEVLRVRGKGDKERLVPLTEAARAALEALGGRIPLAKRTIQRRFRDAGITAHQWRHTFGTELADSGADLGEMQDLLGHASPATTRVYSAYSLDRLRRALERRDSRRPHTPRGGSEVVPS